MAVVTMRQLLGAGVHFGHQTRRWNPKMRRYILGERNGIYLIDLRKTLDGIDGAYGYVRDLVAGGGNILFVGTKKQTQGPVADYAGACGMPYVNQRWLGGMLTNFSTVSGRVKRMQELRAMQAAGDFDAMPKKEALRHVRELEKLSRNLGGISGLDRLPEAIFVIDTKKEHIAVTEANKLGLPVVAVVDTNCDPDVIDYVIPGNDDAIRSGTLMCRVIADAVVEGRWVASHRPAPKAAAPAAPAAPAPPRPPARATVDASVPEGAVEAATAEAAAAEAATSAPAPAAPPTPAAAPAAAPAPAPAPAAPAPEAAAPAPAPESPAVPAPAAAADEPGEPVPATTEA
ncbi:MAG TPA: 30S ribosomal protein S2 [Acidimicrobiales bacterium]|jgi:small subunit ribosomal protein S2|nr:30S ribosomal protein S2 [Acidimicrobiales bacterium]